MPRRFTDTVNHIRTTANRDSDSHVELFGDMVL
jgi:hypothetical protein